MMTRQKIRLLITLMGMAALGLVGFQWHWVTSALALRNEQFNLKVSDAMQDVVRKLEKQEIIYLIRQREEIEQQRIENPLLTYRLFLAHQPTHI